SALLNNAAYAELICDGHHVHQDVAAMAYERKQDKLILITDCMRAGLLEDGNYKLGEFDVRMQNGIARMDNGSLAGSTLTLIDGVRNLTAWTKEPLYKIWHRASLSPAKILGIAKDFGSIAAGKIADLTVIDETIAIQATAIAGEIQDDRYKRPRCCMIVRACWGHNWHFGNAVRKTVNVHSHIVQLLQKRSRVLQ